MNTPDLNAISPQPGDALLIVDVQNDFLPGGSLAVLRDMLASGAPVDGFGIGTRKDTSSDVPYLDCAYKLQEYAGRARRKRSEGKQTWPGRKQVYRSFDDYGRMSADVVTLEGDVQTGEPLLMPVMRAGQRLAAPALADIRDHAAANLARLPEPLRQLHEPYDYRVEISGALHELAAQVDRNAFQQQESMP